MRDWLGLPSSIFLIKHWTSIDIIKEDSALENGCKFEVLVEWARYCSSSTGLGSEVRVTRVSYIQSFITNLTNNILAAWITSAGIFLLFLFLAFFCSAKCNGTAEWKNIYIFIR